MPQYECCFEHLEFVRNEKGASLLLLNLLGQYRVGTGPGCDPSILRPSGWNRDSEAAANAQNQFDDRERQGWRLGRLGAHVSAAGRECLEAAQVLRDDGVASRRVRHAVGHFGAVRILFAIVLYTHD